MDRYRKIRWARTEKRIDDVHTPEQTDFMDQRYELKGITFVWDSNKAQANLAKHGVAFSQAAQAFFDPFLCVTDAGNDSETRDAVIGMDERWNLLFVVHLMLEEDIIRIISARKATTSERSYYEY